MLFTFALDRGNIGYPPFHFKRKNGEIFLIEKLIPKPIFHMALFNNDKEVFLIIVYILKTLYI